MEAVNFNKKIYNLEAINKAICEFKNLANFTIEDRDNNIAVKIDKIDKEVKDILKDEFANYVLGLMS